MKLLKNILYIILAISIAICVYCAFFLKKVDTYSYYEYEALQSGKDPNKIEEVEQEAIYPDDYYIFAASYSGEIPKSYFYEGLYEFVKYMPKLYENTKKLNTSGLNEYYKKNQKEIEQITGITNVEYFNELAKMVKIFEKDEVKYSSSKLLTETFNKNENNVSFKLEITFTDQSKMNFEVIFSNINFSETPLLQFIPLV